MNSKVVIVVEGTHDEAKIKQLNNEAYLTVSVGGMLIDKSKIELVKKLSQKYETILFFDADFPGTKIRQKISNEIPDAKHAYLSYKKSRGPKNKVGVEHGSLKDIDAAIKKAITIPISKSGNNIWTTYKLHSFKLINHIDSKLNREKLTDYLNIGSSNGKQLLNKLNALKIDEKIVKKVLNVTSI